MQGIAKDIKDIAQDFSCPISEVEQILSSEMHQLEQGAHIKDFVPVLAIKRVKDLLRLNLRPPPVEPNPLLPTWNPRVQNDLKT